MYRGCKLLYWCPASASILQHLLTERHVTLAPRSISMQLVQASCSIPLQSTCGRRDVVARSLRAVVDAAEALRSQGFVNYFGLQRFGAGVNATHQ